MGYLEIYFFYINYIYMSSRLSTKLIIYVHTGVGTPHKIHLVGWVGCSFRKYYYLVAPPCNLELARFSV